MKRKHIGTAICGTGLLMAFGIVGRDDVLMQRGLGGLPIAVLILGCLTALCITALGIGIMVKGWQDE